MKNFNASLSIANTIKSINMDALQIEQQISNPPIGSASNVFSKKKQSIQLINELAKRMNLNIETRKVLGGDTILLITIPNGEASSHSDSLPLTFAPNENAKSKQKEHSFIQKIRKVIHKNIEDETFGIPQLCQTIHISRSQLHNKIKAMTELSTSIFIRLIRLKKAKLLLENSELNVSEVAYSVGFKDPSYFSRLFVEKFGVPPSKVEKAMDRVGLF